MYYQISLIKDHSRQNDSHAVASLQAHETELKQHDITLYGIFSGIFGLASNEIYAVTCAEQRHSLQLYLTEAGLEPEASHVFRPTVRPAEHSPRTVPGIYVFRWFQVRNADVNEIVSLSNQAWKNFETDEVQVQGLFADPTADEVLGQMLLITRYDSLAAWETSRDSAPAARENFRRRAALTQEARPIATRLAL